MRVNAFRIAFTGQIRFNAGAQLKGEEEMRKQFAVLAVGCLTLGFMAALGSAQADKAARPSPAAKATCTLAEDDYRGLLESAGEGAEDLRWFGAVRRGVAHGGE